jgi:DNA helicase-2/ATP-dependent DNA helicase PcrA
MQPQNQTTMNSVTKKEINAVERILLPIGQDFGTEDSERVQIIKDITNSCHVVACPGSGKTTVLLAKLLILAERMPFENNQGICVLTHTNVAIDEIKRKAGRAGDKLFKYPNFFGTIQAS